MGNYLNIITLTNHCGWLIKNNHSFLHAFLEGIVIFFCMLILCTILKATLDKGPKSKVQ
jgi:hypothetical protein